MEKSVDAFRTISEVAEDLALPQHVLRFWETRFPQIKPLKRAGGRRYYRPTDVVLLRTIRQLLYEEGFTIKGVQKLLKEQGTRAVRSGTVAMPVDLATLEVVESKADVFVAERLAPTFAELEAEPALPESVRAALDTLVPSLDETSLSRHDLAALRDALATIDECERILNAVRRPRG